MKKDVFSFDYCIKDGKKIYFSSNIFNGLIEYDSVSCISNYLGMFDGYPINKQGMHSKSYEYNGKLFFFPNNIRDIHIYDMNSNEISRISLGIEELDRYRAIDSVRIDNIVWILGAYIDSPLLSYNLASGDIIRIDGIYLNAPKQIVEKNKPILWSKVTYFAGCIYGAVWGSNYVVKIDLMTHRSIFVNLECGDYKFSGITIHDGRFYFSLLESEKVISYDKNLKNHEIINSIIPIEANGLVYSALISTPYGLLIVPNKENFVLLIIEKKIVPFVYFPEGYKDLVSYGRTTWRRVYDYDVLDHLVEIYPCRGSMFLTINMIEKKIIGRQIIFEDERYGEDYKLRCIEYLNECKCNGLIKETDCFTINDFLDYYENNK